MGIFKRKNSKPLSSETSQTYSNLRNSTAMQSPGSAKPNGSTFSSPSLPDVSLPKPPDPNVDPAAYLRSIYSIRERTKIIFEKAKKNQLTHFNVDMEMFTKTAEYTVSIIKVRRCMHMLK